MNAFVILQYICLEIELIDLVQICRYIKDIILILNCTHIYRYIQYEIHVCVTVAFLEFLSCLLLTRAIAVE